MHELALHSQAAYSLHLYVKMYIYKFWDSVKLQTFGGTLPPPKDPHVWGSADAHDLPTLSGSVSPRPIPTSVNSASSRKTQLYTSKEKEYFWV